MTDVTPTPGRAEHAPAHVEHVGRSPARPTAAMLLSVVVVVLLVLGIGLAGGAIGRSTKGSPDTITVTGTGTVQGVPNTIEFTLGVQTTEPTAPGALSVNDRRMSALEARLKSDGVLAKDMQTSGLNIYQNTNQSGVVTGFTAQETLDVTMNNITKAGIAIEDAAKIAGNGIVFNGITLSISNDSKLLQEARSKAMHDAFTDASGDAVGGGTSVGSIIRITDEQSSNVVPYPLPYGDALSAEHGIVPIEAGQQPITVQLTVVYALNN